MSLNRKPPKIVIPISIPPLRKELYVSVKSKKGTPLLKLNYGKSLHKKLLKIYRGLNKTYALYKWPKDYQPYSSAHSKQWKSVLINYLMSTNEEKNMRTKKYATDIFEKLTNEIRVWGRDLWVVLFENLSEMIKDDTLFQKIVEDLLVTAWHEKNHIYYRKQNLLSLLSDNTWYKMCQNVLLNFEDEFLVCNIVLLFLALSGKEKVYIRCYITNPREELEILFLMTESRWKNLAQIVVLLKEKRQLMHQLSSYDVVEQESLPTEEIDQALDSNIKKERDNVKSEIGKNAKNLDEQDLKSKITTDLKKEVVSSNEENKIDMKLEAKSQDEVTPEVKSEIDVKIPPTRIIKVENDEIPQNNTTITVIKKEIDEEVIPTNETKITIKQEENSFDFTVTTQVKKEIEEEITPSIDKVKLEPEEIPQVVEIKEEIDEIPQNNTTVTVIKKEIDEEVMPTNEAKITLKQKESSLDVTLTTEVKKEIEEEITPLIDKLKLEPEEIPQVVEIKEEVENIILVGLENEQPKVDKKQNKSLDDLILHYSIQEINKSTGNSIVIDCIDISEDEDDCVVCEDKIQVEELLTMYQDMVSKPNQPGKLVRNPLAEQINVKEEAYSKEIKEEPKQLDFIKLVSCESDSNRVPSTTSTASTRMNVSMGRYKERKRVKRRHNKTNAKVKKLFQHLRNESQASSSADNTVIELDKTVRNRKRTLSPLPLGHSRVKKARYFSRVIPTEAAPLTPKQPITVEESYTPKGPPPVHCSTPIAKKSCTKQELAPIKNQNSKCNNNITEVQNFNNEITDLTKEINNDSYLTIDLTTESLNCSSINKSQDNTVIDLDNTTDNANNTVITVDNSNLSISGESDVTVLNMKKEMQMRQFAKGISKLDASEKGRLLELITQNIFNGCKVIDKRKGSAQNEPAPSEPETYTRATETVEDTYIKEVILGQTSSRNSIGSNIYNPERDLKHKTGLRLIVIDGSNVAMEHGRGKIFSVKGLKICIDYFLKRGHVVKAFVPRFRCKFGKSSDPRLLDQLERRGLVVYTPSREIQGRMVTSYDDRYIVQCAAEFDGVIVSGDNYRDLLRENPRWRFVIENRLLQFTWVNDMIMFPKDPLGRDGPTLEQFLRHPPQANVTNLVVLT